MLGTRQRQRLGFQPTGGSRTATVAPERPAAGASSTNEEHEDPVAPRQGVLRLHGGPRSRPQVAWTEDVVDNEGAGRKKSKICCIYHKPRAFDESSSESSDPSSDEDSDRKCQHNHAQSRRNVPIGGAGGGGGGGGGEAKEKDAAPADKNAYEATPKDKGKGKAAGKQ